MKTKVVVVFSSHLGDTVNEEFTNQVHKTIGITHEVVCYENYNEFSLSEIYNKAIDAHYYNDVVMVFCHPDIIFKTQNWGKILVNAFNHSQYGIIGVAGTVCLPESGMWWEHKDAMYGIVEHTDGTNTWTNTYSKPIGGLQGVVTIDGLFMAVDCGVTPHRFDESFGKFHFYDLSFCLPNYLDGVNIGVTTNIRILHKSIGMVNEDWEKNKDKFAKYYAKYLPAVVDPIYKEIKVKLNSEPKVTVIIPTKNNLSFIKNNIESWKENVTYKNYEIIVADTGSDDDVIYDLERLCQDNIKLVKYDHFNFGGINNDVVRNHVSEDTEIVLFCNDDIVLLNDALSRCVQIYNENKKTVGTIGIRLHYENSSVQHCGILVFRDAQNRINLSHTDFKRFKDYSTNVNYKSIGNTGAFLMMGKDLFNQIGGFNENYIECFEDVELNLKCLLLKKKNITVCDAVAYHFESISRDKDSKKLDKLRIDYVERLAPFYKENRDALQKHIPLVK